MRTAQSLSARQTHGWPVWRVRIIANYYSMIINFVGIIIVTNELFFILGVHIVQGVTQMSLFAERADRVITHK